LDEERTAASRAEADGQLPHPAAHVLLPPRDARSGAEGAIQELAGHAQLTTTMRYMHLAEGQKEQAIRLLERRPAAGQVAGMEAGLEAVEG